MKECKALGRPVQDFARDPDAFDAVAEQTLADIKNCIQKRACGDFAVTGDSLALEVVMLIRTVFQAQILALRRENEALIRRARR